jgi:hypothetical protein
MSIGVGEGTELTATGTLVGTPRYLAPERWTGSPATPGSDVFSMGLVLHELCGGTAHRGRSGVPDWFIPTGRLAPDMPPALAEVIDRAVRIVPADRYASAEEVRDALERIAAVLEPAPSLSTSTAERPQTRYARAGDVSIAYQVLGRGPIDLLVIPGFVSHVELPWEEPSFARFLERLATGRRLILFDKRGTGLSDRVDVSSLSERMEDARAVMDAVGSERASIFGLSDGAMLAALFAITYPERTRSLILYGTTGRALKGPDYPDGLDPGLYEFAFAEIRRGWEPIF